MNDPPSLCRWDPEFKSFFGSECGSGDRPGLQNRWNVVIRRSVGSIPIHSRSSAISVSLTACDSSERNGSVPTVVATSGGQ